MRILLTGATGFVGTPLARALFLAGHELVILSRDAQRARRRVGVAGRYVSWQPLDGPTRGDVLSGVDAVFNLMGENLGGGRWTEARKQAIYGSRVVGTRNLVTGLRNANPGGVALWVNFSAIGYYPVNKPDRLDESSDPGEGFTARVCIDWEAAAASGNPAARQVVLRVGTVLGASGGALDKLLPVFKAGLGGPVGRGRQIMSWIHREDLVRLCLQCLGDDSMKGVFNAVAPEPVSNAAFSRALGRAVDRPARLPAPPAALKLALGQMASLVLDGQSIVSSRLAPAGFDFHYGDLKEALGEAAGRVPLGLNGEVLVCDRFEDFTFIERPPEEVFGFFAEPSNLEAITPDSLRFRIQRVSDQAVTEGTVIDYRLRLHGLPLHWRTLIREWDPPNGFVDYQMRGPYRAWNHRHDFTAVHGGTAMQDRVDYRLPLEPAGRLARPLVQNDVQKIFDFRRRTILAHFGDDSEDSPV